MDFQTEQERKVDGLRESVKKVSSAFKIKRFYLDTAASRNDFQGNNVYQFPFKSFWIVNTNNTGFVASMYVNPKVDGGDALPLKPNMSIPFEYQQNGCALEWESQPGVWIDIAFAFNSDILPGFTNLNFTGDMALDEGDSFTDSKKSIDNSGTSALCASSTTRKKAIIQNTSGQPIWMGSQASLASVDYQKICQRLDHGFSFEWKNKAALYARVQTTTTDSIGVMELT